MSVDESQFFDMLVKLKTIFADCVVKFVERQDLESDDGVGHFVPPFYVIAPKDLPECKWKFDYDQAVFVTTHLTSIDQTRKLLIEKCGFHLEFTWWFNRL